MSAVELSGSEDLATGHASSDFSHAVPVEGFDPTLADGSFTLLDREGGLHRLPGLAGYRMMEIIRDFGFDIPAICGGAAACGTCHVYVEPGDMARLAEPSEEESYQLDHLLTYQPQSRLSCQIIWDRAVHDGMHVALAPKE
ncbi:MAG: 2Fe-2S iron-sulfur cluster binding domain-containing protein [Proteobacteria bacterium]|nr:2Fe-2S iron-sulfur cluster binding domain-containing protein [Pseudomonadota bacterium]